MGRLKPPLKGPKMAIESTARAKLTSQANFNPREGRSFGSKGPHVGLGGPYVNLRGSHAALCCSDRQRASIDLRRPFPELRWPFAGLKGPSFGPRNSCAGLKGPCIGLRGLSCGLLSMWAPVRPKRTICQHGRACVALRGPSYGPRSNGPSQSSTAPPTHTPTDCRLGPKGGPLR